MRLLFILILIIHSTYMYSQLIGINGGIMPNGLKGTHFGSRIEFPLKDKFNISLNYNLVKYTDFFAVFGNFNLLHKEYKNDQTLIPYKEFDRGIPIQSTDQDFRPSDLNHSFAILFGYQLINNKHLSSSIKIGPHISFYRTYYHSFTVGSATIQFTENSEVIPLSYYDYEIFRSWDIGPTGRIDIEYKLFENVSIGLMSIMYMDIIGEGIDLCAGLSLNFNFSNSKE